MVCCFTFLENQPDVDHEKHQTLEPTHVRVAPWLGYASSRFPLTPTETTIAAAPPLTSRMPHPVLSGGCIQQNSCDLPAHVKNRQSAKQRFGANLRRSRHDLTADCLPNYRLFYGILTVQILR